MTNDRSTRERIRGANPEMDRLQAARSAGVHARFFAAHLEPGMAVLDCGCGRGTVTIGLAQLVSPGSVQGIDLDVQRIADAKKLAKSQQVENVQFQVGDAHHLPFPDGFFDSVYEHAMLQHLEDPTSAAREVYRVLKPGGFFGASDRIQGQGAIVSPEAPWTEYGKMRRAVSLERGSHMDLGLRLHLVLKEAGFEAVIPSASFEMFVTPQEKRDVADWGIASVTDNEFRATAIRLGLADEARFIREAQMFEDFANSPDSWLAAPNGEAIGWKPRG